MSSSVQPQEAPVKSPCISVCALNEQDLCIGCWRSIDEIAGWARMSEVQKREVMVRVRAREAAHNPFA